MCGEGTIEFAVVAKSYIIIVVGAGLELLLVLL